MGAANIASELASACLHRRLTCVLIVLAFLSLASAWRIDLWGFASDNIGAGAANASLQILVTLFVAYGLWQVVSIWVDRLIADDHLQRAEQLGFGAFFRSDHYLKMGDTSGLPGPTDAWVTLGGIARETSTIRLGTLVTAAISSSPCTERS